MPRLIMAVITVLVLAAGTIVDRIYGSEYASTHVYNSWWFIALVSVIAIAALYDIIHNRLWHKPHIMLIASSVVAILLGGALSTFTGLSGEITLHPGVASQVYETDKGNIGHLPFTVTLDNFEIVTYPGSHAPMDFVSHVIVDGETVDISMNNIFRHKGYRFYQSDYDNEGNSILTVTRDPWGIGVTYIGYLLLTAGIIVMFCSHKSRFRKLLRNSCALTALLISTHLLFTPNCAYATPSTLPRHSAEKMGEIYVLYKDRVCPIQTLAKDFTTKLYGKPSYKGLTAEQVLSGWIFYYSEWADEPMIKIKGEELRSQLTDGGKYTTYNTLLTNEKLFQDHPLPKNLKAAYEKLNIIRMIANSELLKIYPYTDSMGVLTWYSQNSPLPPTISDKEYLFIRKQLSYCQELVVRGDFNTLDQVFDKTVKYQTQKASNHLPSITKIKAERLYNSIGADRPLAMGSISIGLLLFGVSIYGSTRNRRLPRWVGIASLSITSLLTTFLAMLFVLRWIIGGHAPMAGGFDTMNMMAIAIGVLSICVNKRQPIATSIGLLIMGFCLLVAMMSGANPPVTHLMPVLNSPLLTIHVTVIMISYALFAFVLFISLAALITPSHSIGYYRLNLLLLYPAVSLLAIGIMIGAVWANISWGSYWSWDPKEVWALITLIVYLVPLFMTPNSKRSMTTFHIYCVLAIISVVITYFGVNLILGGMHSYN